MNPRRFTSRLAESLVADDRAQPWRFVNGTVVLADLSGFTRLTERLQSAGPEGAERLHDVLQLAFHSLLGDSIAGGGDVIGFAGDAALVWFDGDDHVVRAVEAAASMPRELARLPAAVTGGSRLGVSVGVHTGEFLAVIAGPHQCGLFICGEAMSRVVTLESEARSGQVLMSHAVAAAVPEVWHGDPHGSGVAVRRLRRRQPRTSTVGGTTAVPDPAQDVGSRTRRLLAPSVWDVLNASQVSADHRTVSVGFLEVSGLDALVASDGGAAVHEVLDRVAARVGVESQELGVEWIDVDAGVDSVRFILVAGAPRAIDDDEGRLMLALRRIIDTCDAPVRAGAQRGQVFAATLGVAERQTYTVLGDPVNVAARALGMAREHELVAADGMGVDTRVGAVFVALGPKLLKNRRRPMPMWSVRDVAAVSTSLRPRQRLVAEERGRADEAQQLIDSWNKTIHGIGCSIVLVSEPGMGAAGLIESLTTRAGDAATSLVAHPFLQSVPYAALSEVCKQLARFRGQVPDDPILWLMAHADELPSELRRWADLTQIELTRSEVSVEPETRREDALNRVMRTRVVLAALLRLVTPRPWLLAVDNFDRIDSVSRAVIVELMTTVSGEAVMLLASVEHHLDGAGSPRGATVIQLTALDDVGAIALVVEVAPRLRDDVIGRIVRAGKGNPFVLAELARNPDLGGLPDSLQRLSVMLVDSLPVPIRTVVREASAFGSTVSLSALADVLQRPELAASAWWTNAFPVMRPGPHDTVQFRHDALRVAAHDSLTFRRRHELHRAIAEHQQRLGDASQAELAVHFEHAGMLPEAYAASRAAGLAAKSAGAMAEACGLLRQALGLARSVDRPGEGRLHLELAEALDALGDLDAAAESFKSAGRRLSDNAEAARVWHGRASLALTRGRFAQARAAVRNGLRAVEGSGPGGDEMRGRLLLDLAAVRDLAGRHQRSLGPAGEALELAKQSGNRTLEGMAHLHLGMAMVAMMRHEALDHVTKAVEIFEAVGHDRYLNSSLNNSGLVAMYLGRWDEAIERYRKAAIHGARCGLASDTAIVEMNIGFLMFRQGQLEEAEAQARRAMHTFDAIGVRSQSGVSRYLLSEIDAAAGRSTSAATWMSSAREVFVALDDDAMLVDCDVTEMEQHVRAGRLDEARALLPAIETRRSSAEVAIAIALDRTLGRLAMREADFDGAVRLIENALVVAREHQLAYDVYLCLEALIEALDDVEVRDRVD
ncbi:MAG: adenylate/guanylate cyclase domain-containing protein, partial [Ilumatobacteraceae bacterium]